MHINKKTSNSNMPDEKIWLHKVILVKGFREIKIHENTEKLSKYIYI